MFLIGSNYPASWYCFSEFFEQTTTMAEISFDAPALLDDIREQLRRLKTSLMLLEEVAQTSDNPVLFAVNGDFLSESVDSVKAGSRALCDNIDRVEEIMEPSSVPEVSPMFQEAFVPPPPPAPSPPLPSQYTLHTESLATTLLIWYFVLMTTPLQSHRSVMRLMFRMREGHVLHHRRIQCPSASLRFLRENLEIDIAVCARSPLQISQRFERQ